MERDRDVIEVLNEIVGRKPRWSFWKLHDRLRLEGCRINHKRLHRVYCAMGLNVPEDATSTAGASETAAVGAK
jgi:putative transposase